MSEEASKSNLQLEGLLLDNLHVDDISSFFMIPQALKDAEVKKMVQRQVELRTTVFNQKD